MGGDHERRPLVVVLGLPKAGTSSVGEYFSCHGWRVSHWLCETPNTTATTTTTTTTTKCTFCFHDWLARVAAREHPGSRGWREQLDLATELRRACGAYDVFAELNLQLHNLCLYPQVSHLHTLVRVLPHACFVLNTRPLPHWLESVKAWGLKTINTSSSLLSGGSKHAASYQPERDSMLAKMLNSCPVWPRTEEGVLRWHSEHLERARDALRNHSCAIELDIEEPSAGDRLARRFPGTRASCWAQHNHWPPSTARILPTSSSAAKTPL